MYWNVLWFDISSITIIDSFSASSSRSIVQMFLNLVQKQVWTLSTVPASEIQAIPWGAELNFQPPSETWRRKPFGPPSMRLNGTSYFGHICASKPGMHCVERWILVNNTTSAWLLIKKLWTSRGQYDSWRRKRITTSRQPNKSWSHETFLSTTAYYDAMWSTSRKILDNKDFCQITAEQLVPVHATEAEVLNRSNRFRSSNILLNHNNTQHTINQSNK